MRKFIVSALVVSGALCAPAVAEISDETVARYNAAVQANDVPNLLTAAEALAREAVASPEDRDAALLAFEAAWALCRNGECEAAIPAAEFAASQPDTGAHPSLADRELLRAFAHWKADPTKARRSALDASLSNRVQSEPTLLTVAAFHARFVSDLMDRKHALAAKTAGAAADHFFPAREQIGRTWSDAEMIRHTSAYLDDHQPEALLGIAKLHAELALKRHLLEHDPDWLEKRYFETSAWHLAMEAYFLSRNKWKYRSIVDEASDIVDSALSDGHVHAPEYSPHEDSEPPRCSGEIVRSPEPEYPDHAQSNGYVGAIIVVFDLNKSGLHNLRIGASVPTDMFDGAVLDAMEEVKWEWENTGSDGQPCLKEIKDMFYPFVFRLG